VKDPKKRECDWCGEEATHLYVSKRDAPVASLLLACDSHKLAIGLESSYDERPLEEFELWLIHEA
jgi:hypothetical protein